MAGDAAAQSGQTGRTNPQGKLPPRPGDTVPAGGLDPTQVFASPPPPPPPPPSSGAGQHDDGLGGGMPPQDSGPPPPKKGVKATKEMGYDDEDLRVLGEVGDYRFGDAMATLSNAKVTIPPHSSTSFDEQKFLTLLRGSISLTRDEKWRIIQAVPKLSQFQVDELQKILEEERRKFGELSPKHLAQLKRLEEKHAGDWNDLQAVTVQQSQKAEDQQEADAIRKQLGL
ncbi:hypothetical protein A2635_02545 [Candidatus Peribacteria bacterium RIFCSPHIGHO2_01_FULL_51_9]|nr:MAG: hypothetical protein A2635_02545 [Candidatus Peribacteria bacterium RIFCSPHIGHO2_01_FULL_51_9]